jgi:hypothetical protein
MDMISLVRVHLCCTCVILFILFCSMCYVHRARANRRIKDTRHLDKCKIRINIVPNGTSTNAAHLISAIAFINNMTRYSRLVQCDTSIDNVCCQHGTTNMTDVLFIVKTMVRVNNSSSLTDEDVHMYLLSKMKQQQ